MIEGMFGLLSFILIGVGILSPTLDYTILKGRKFVSPWMTIAALILSGWILVYLGATSISQPAAPIFGGMMEVGFFEIFLSLIATLGAVFVAVASLVRVRRWSTSPSFYSLLSLAVLGAYYLIAAHDFVLLIGTWALVSVISYVLVGIKKDERSVEGAVKYSLMGILASVLILYSIAMAYSLTGSTDVGAISTVLGSVEKPLVLLTSVFFVSAFGFKIGIVPFHGWLPDVYGKVHPMLVAFLTGVVAVAVGGVLIKILYPLAPLIGAQWPVLIGLLSIFTMTFGNIVALLQKNLQMMMAYSSIAHMGYILVGVTAALSPDRALGLQGIGLHFVTYMLASVGMFVFLAYLIRKGVGSQMEDLKGLGRRVPIVSVAILIILLSLMGIPPLIGFWSKFYLFTSVIAVAPWLALIAIINSGISLGYYIQPIRYMFFGEGAKPAEEKLREPDAAIVVLVALLIIAAGFLLPSLAPYLAI
jgi:NADH-quinone oxidoreductase subunit N